MWRMNDLRTTRSILFALLASLIIWGCSESTTPEEGGITDTTPPSIEGVTVQDGSHIQVVFDENVDKATAEHEPNYLVYRSGLMAAEAAQAPPAAGDTLGVDVAALDPDGRSVVLTLYPGMQGDVGYIVEASRIKDTKGNEMTAPDTASFMGVASPDTTPPYITHRSPAPGETNVGIGASVEVTFSESMDFASVRAAFSWTGPSGDVPFEMGTIDNNVYVFSPYSPLSYNTQYTVSFAANTAQDQNFNYLPGYSWSFRTTATQDNTPPTIVSTNPANGATNVSIDTALEITFSEPIEPNSLYEGSIMMTPETPEGVFTWTNGGRTLHYQPDQPLFPDTTYTLLVLEGAVTDMAGNLLAEAYLATFSTGSSFPSGSIAGTISGDASSLDATDPEGATIVAFVENILYQEPIHIGGAAFVDRNGDYLIEHVEDGTYWPFGILDSNNDGELNPEYGDAIGMYGLDWSTFWVNPDADSVVVAGGSQVTGVDFALYDPVAIAGRVAYGGTQYQSTLENYSYYVGVFDTTNFDPASLDPDYGTDGDNIYWDPEYSVTELGDSLQDGTYYVGAYMDVNYNYSYDPGTDPAGFYEVSGVMAPVTVIQGRDALDIDIMLEDPSGPVGPGPTTPISWVRERSSERERLLALLRKLSMAVRNR